MHLKDGNPYQPPETGITPPEGFTQANRPRVPFVAYLFVAASYHLFIWVLLRSTPVDQKVGTLLLFNTPVFASWGMPVWLGSRHSITWGIVAVGMQCGIAAFTILRDIGDWQATILFDCIVIFAIAAVVVLCWRYHRIDPT